MSHYLDNAATTPVIPAAAQALMDALPLFGNPSSRHALGLQSAALLQDCRSSLAGDLGCLPEELVFTSGGTEGDSWCIRIATEKGVRRGKHIITTAIEHSAILEPLKLLEQQGYEITRLAPDKNGLVSPAAVGAALRPDTILLTMMLVNNEVGSVLPVGECARLAHAYSPDILVHTDGVQGFQKVPCVPQELDVDLLTLTGHKIGGPKGIGGFYIRKGLTVKPLFPGGGQESGLRSGTESLPMIAAFAAAAHHRATHFAENIAHMAALKDYAATALQAIGGTVLVQGDAPHILPISLPGYPSEMVVRELSDRGIYLSSGSACHRGKPSHVFAALGLPARTLTGVLRVSFSPESTREDVDALAAALADITARRVATGR